MNAMKNQQAETVCCETEKEGLIKYCLLLLKSRWPHLYSSDCCGPQFQSRLPQGPSKCNAHPTHPSTSAGPRLRATRLLTPGFSDFTVWHDFENPLNTHRCAAPTVGVLKPCQELLRKRFPRTEVCGRKHLRSISKGPQEVLRGPVIPSSCQLSDASVYRLCTVSLRFHDSLPTPAGCYTSSSRQKPIVKSQEFCR